MKINIQRVVKCLSCLVTCFMLVVACMTTPVNAAAYLDPSDYLVEVTAEGTTKTAHYSFPSIDWLITAWNSTTGVYEDFVGDAVYFPDVSYKQALFQGYPLGGPVYGSNIPWNGVVFDVSDILPGSPIDIEIPVSLFVNWVTYELVDVHVEMKYGVAYYDKDGNLKDTIEGDPEYYTFTMGAITSNSWGTVVSIGGTIPADAYYIAPYVTVDTVLSDYVPDMQIRFDGGYVDLYVDINTVIENSNMMQSINDKLDNIITGTPEQNENADNALGDAENQKDKIEDLLDQAKPNKPNTDDIDTDINAIAGDEATSLFADGMSAILNNSLILGMLSIVSVVCFIGYVLFGKVG